MTLIYTFVDGMVDPTHVINIKLCIIPFQLREYTKKQKTTTQAGAITRTHISAE